MIFGAANFTIYNPLMATNKLHVRIGDVMTREPYSLSPMDRVKRAEELCKTHQIHHLPVVDTDGRVVGMLSQSDLWRISYGVSLFRNRDPQHFNQTLFASVLVRDVMIREVITLTSEDTVKDALAIFAQNRFHAIPIVENGNLVGIVTPLDLLKFSFYPIN